MTTVGGVVAGAKNCDVGQYPKYNRTRKFLSMETDVSLPRELLEIVRSNTTLCLNVENPGWDDARGYLIDKVAPILYFPVSKTYLPANPHEARVLIWSQPRLIVQGSLLQATSDDDGQNQLRLALDQGLDEVKARSMIFDSRTGRPRKTRHKLVAERICVAHPHS
jgi:hypothetical protein